MNNFRKTLPAKVARLLKTLRAQGNLDELGAVIRAAHDVGWTYATLGHAAGFSRERARQLSLTGGVTDVSVPAPPPRGRKPKPRPAKPTLSDDEAAELRAMAEQARTVNGVTRPDDPRRAISASLTARLVDLVKQGYPVPHLATALGISTNAVYFRLYQGGHKIAALRASARTRTGPKLSASDVRAARHAAATGVSVSTLARAYGVHHETMAKAVYGETWRRLTQPPPLPRQKVEARARLNGRLTVAQVADARRRYVAGETKRAIATSLKVGEDTVREAIHGVTWRHVTNPPPVPRSAS